MMGGSAKIMAKGQQLLDQGKYLEASEILNKLMLAESRNMPARRLLADAYEQLGYQAESTSVRNSYLQGAYELRNGLPAAAGPRSSGPDVIRAMSTEMWLDFLGISMDPKRADGLNFTMNFITPDNGEKFLVELSNATLTNIQGVQAENPTLTLTINRSDLNQIMMGVSSFDAMAKAGKAKFEGNPKPFAEFGKLLVSFTPDFEILPGTAPVKSGSASASQGKPFEAPAPDMYAD